MRKVTLPRWLDPGSASAEDPPEADGQIQLEASPFFRGLNLKPTREVELASEAGPPRKVVRYEGIVGTDVDGKFRVRILSLQVQDPGTASPSVMEYSLFLDKVGREHLAKARKARLRIFRDWVEMHAWPEDIVTRLLDQFNEAERHPFHVSQDPVLARLGIAITSSASDTFLTWVRVP
jgi:hypothetical protein